MPGKGRKVAARQAQVGRRRRRQTRETVSMPEAVSGVMVAEHDETKSSVTNDPDSQVNNVQSNPRMMSSSRGARSVGIRGEQMFSNGLVKSEFIRISIMAGALNSTLVILAVFI